MNRVKKHAGRIIDVLSLLFCLGMAWLFRAESLWMEVWLVGAAMSFASVWLDTTGRMIVLVRTCCGQHGLQGLRTDYVKTVLRTVWMRPRAGVQPLGRPSRLPLPIRSASASASGASRQVQPMRKKGR